MERFYAGQRILTVQKFIFPLAHLMEGQELHACKADAFQQSGDAPGVFKPVVKSGDHWNPGEDGESLFVCPCEVCHDRFIPHAGAFLVEDRVVVLDVEQQQIKLRRQPLEYGRTDKTGGLDRSVDTALF